MNDVLDLEITDVAYGGQGVARSSGMVVFISGTLPGEIIKATIRNRKKNFAEADLLEIVKPAPGRIAPGCPLAYRMPVGANISTFCPGCAYQHASYDLEIALKNAQLRQLLVRLARIPSPDLLPPCPSPSCLEYRNKMVLHANMDDTGTRLGYFAADNNTILDITACPLAVRPLNDLLSNRRTDPAFMDSLHEHQDVWFRHTNINGPLSWFAGHPPLKYLTEKTAAGPLLIPPEGFFQVNPAVANELLIHVTRIVKEKKPEMVLDLYSGAGLFALAVAQAGVPDCRGVEIDNSSVQCARQNAATLNLTNLKFSSGAAEDAMRRLPTPDIRRPTMIIMDPPRRGLEKQLLQTLTGKRPNWLLYISCAPDTLARDLAVLRTAGYNVESIRLFDMFPRTMHFETVCLLSS